MSISRTGAPAAPLPLASDPPPIVGRVAEVSRLEDAVRAVGEGRGGTIHVVGEAGAGKTTLLEIVHRRAAHDGLLVCVTTIDETGVAASHMGPR